MLIYEFMMIFRLQHIRQQFRVQSLQFVQKFQQRLFLRIRPPIRMTVMKKSDAVKMMKDKKSFGVPDLPPVYLTKTVEED
ncbi:hypothetical protein AgCh_015239 [Apium graveolens]